MADRNISCLPYFIYSIDMGFSTEKSGTDEKADFSEPAEIDYR